MFTGIIEEVGIIGKMKKNAQSAVLTIGASLVLNEIKQGDSIAVNGICLTVISFTDNSFTADVMHETMKRSTLGDLHIGNLVNLERSMPAAGRFGGHIVAGHIDGTGVIYSIHKDDNALWYTIQTTPSILRYVVEKGSIAIDGISLTVAKVSEKDFCVSIIPHTIQNTNLFHKKIGDLVNLENDCIGKYVEKLLEPYTKQTGINKEFLSKYGY